MQKAVEDQPLVLRFENVSRRFGAHTAVDCVGFELRRGEVLTLLGPSGCGKTTTLRIAIGLERAGAGRVHYRDRVVDSPAERIFVAPEQRDMGMVFQSYAIWPHMNVFENVAFPLRTRRTDQGVVAAKVAAILGQVGLTGYEDRSGMQLSGGQQQRVAVARGLIASPDVLLMDEPFSNLDAKLRDQMRAELKILQRRLGLSILFVTHDQTEALALSDRIAVMRDGRIEQIGTPVDLYTNPQVPFVRDFLGQSLLLQGRVVRSETGVVRVRLEHGQVIDASGRNHLTSVTPDMPCLLVIRPEEMVVAVGPEAAVAEPSNTIRATIRTLLFLGPDYEAVVELPQGQLASLHLRREAMWQEGQAIHLGLPADKLQIWDRQKDSHDQHRPRLHVAREG
ncbi:MAG: Putrescine transport ATP-binding protein [Rhodospirillales bacterium]|jgi:ABC-type Fe3+/spermidine/putrescine transport system ATPase subunit|nr:Putrescine transport ATP-binding protein [Rhodospirillales bacterium]